jgi:hypothetical protein
LKSGYFLQETSCLNEKAAQPKFHLTRLCLRVSGAILRLSAVVKAALGAQNAEQVNKPLGFVSLQDVLS